MSLKSEFTDGMAHLPNLHENIKTTDEIVVYRGGKPYRITASEFLGGYKLIGYFDYNDAATTESPISVSADTPTILTNDTLGEFSTTQYKPSRITRLWNPQTNRFDFSELNIGDMVDIRIDLNITTTNTYQEVSVDINMGLGQAGAYSIPIIPHNVLKSVDDYKILQLTSVHIGNTLTKDNPASITITTDANASVVVHGWYLKVSSRLNDV